MGDLLKTRIDISCCRLHVYLHAYPDDEKHLLLKVFIPNKPIPSNGMYYTTDEIQTIFERPFLMEATKEELLELAEEALAYAKLQL